MTTKPPLIVLGTSVRAAAQSAALAGYQPYGIDLFADADLQALGPATQIKRYPAEFLSALAAAPQAPWMYTGSLENYPRLVARLAKLRPLLGNGPEVLSRVRDPRWLSRTLAGQEVRYPETLLSREGLSTDTLSGDWVIKPQRSGGGLGIRVGSWESGGGNRASVCQKQVIGESLSAAFVVINKKVIWIGAATQWIGRKWGAPQEFQYAGSLAPVVISAAEQQVISRCAERLSRETGIQGIFGIDLIRNEAGFWLIEVNPRYTASMELHEAIGEQSVITLHCGAFNGAEKPLSNPIDTTATGGYRAKLIVYATEAGIAGDSLQETLDSLAQQMVIAADIPRLGTRLESLSPICTLLLSGANPTVISEQLLSAAREVQQAVGQVGNLSRGL